MNSRKVLSILAVLGGAALMSLGCKSEPLQPAPVTGQEFLQYRLNGQYTNAIETVLIRPHEDGGFVVSSQTKNGFEPQVVDVELANGRRLLKIFHLGWLWLKPSDRKIGALLPMGEVLEQTVWNRIPVFVVGSPNRIIERWYFHTETGFLVGSKTTVSGAVYSTKLQKTNISGLPTG